MRISDWSSDVCSSDLGAAAASTRAGAGSGRNAGARRQPAALPGPEVRPARHSATTTAVARRAPRRDLCRYRRPARLVGTARGARSEEHTSELQSLMSISYAVFCLKKKKHKQQTNTDDQPQNIELKSHNNDRIH